MKKITLEEPEGVADVMLGGFRTDAFGLGMWPCRHGTAINTKFGILTLAQAVELAVALQRAACELKPGPQDHNTAIGVIFCTRTKDTWEPKAGTMTLEIRKGSIILRLGRNPSYEYFIKRVGAILFAQSLVAEVNRANIRRDTERP